ncbi:hypothetical protein NSA18_09085 [Pasteurella caecimuris]|uniref:toxin VasX n=2 Tax=Rodentibacter caecimuris TaxID=1796644 RepID=UPI0021C83EA9|nr:toxin VasX [Pasteurella caecimuris]MCR1838034.1 hypothetical protein [Pasteurella caecimuris]
MKMKDSTQTKQTKPKMKLDVAKINQAAQELSDGHSKCELPIIPLYPVRYGLSIDYLAQARAGNIKNLSEIAPAGIGQSEVHSLMKLRQGFVYIYAHTKHRLFSTDDKGKWLVFRYVTHSDDINSASEFEQLSDYQNAGLNDSFLLCKWGEKGANGNWTLGKIDTSKYPCMTNTISFNTAFVDKDVDIVDIAYSEYMWSSEIIERFEKDDKLRQIVMTTVNVSAPKKHSAPLKDLNIHVLEYQSLNKSNDLSEQTQSWYTKLKNTAIPSALSGFPDYKETGLMVALQDVVGEMHELQKIVLDLAQEQANYHAKYLYPITIGNIIDPKIAYDIRGEKFPLKESERAIAQRGVEKVLHPQFKAKLTELLREPFERYEKPMEKLVDQIWLLGSRNSFQGFLKGISQAITDCKDMEGVSRTAYCFFEQLKDITFGTSSTPNGIDYLSYLFDAPMKHNTPSPFLDWAKQSLSKGVETIQPIVTQGANIGFALNEKWIVAKRIYKGLNDFLETGLNVFGQSAALYKTTTAKQIFSILGISDVWGNAEKSKAAFEKLHKILLQENKKQLSQLSKNERAANKANGKPNQHIDFSATHRKTFLWFLDKQLSGLFEHEPTSISQAKANFDFMFSRSYAGTLNFIAVFSGFIALNEDLALKRKSIKTNAGKWTTNPALVKSAAIMDTAVATMNLSHSAGLMRDPTGFTFKNRPGSIWQTIKGQPLKFGYAALGILGGALTAVVAWGGIEEAKANNDDVSVWGYRLLFYSSISGVVAIAFGLSKIPYVGWVIAALALIGGTLVTFFGDSSLVSWAKNGFWGKTPNYYYWKNQPRNNLEEQINKAKLLEKVSAYHTNEDYSLVAKGFEDEVYGYFIQFGLQITQMSKNNKDRFKVTCAEFWRTIPNLTNLEIVCYLPYAKSRKIENIELTPNRELVFSLAENGIRQENIKLEVTFTDKDGTEFSADYTSDDYILHTMMN